MAQSDWTNYQFEVLDHIIHDHNEAEMLNKAYEQHYTKKCHFDKLLKKYI